MPVPRPRTARAEHGSHRSHHRPSGRAAGGDGSTGDAGTADVDLSQADLVFHRPDRSTISSGSGIAVIPPGKMPTTSMAFYLLPHPSLPDTHKHGPQCPALAPFAFLAIIGALPDESVVALVVWSSEIQPRLSQVSENW
jgi:hypothetical protein